MTRDALREQTEELTTLRQLLWQWYNWGRHSATCRGFTGGWEDEKLKIPEFREADCSCGLLETQQYFRPDDAALRAKRTELVNHPKAAV